MSVKHGLASGISTPVHLDASVITDEVLIARSIKDVVTTPGVCQPSIPTVSLLLLPPV